MALFGHLKCHYCGARSAHSRGTTEFKCTSCDAYNFYDHRGNVVDTPFDYTGNFPSQSSFTQPASSIFDRNPQASQTFCDTCTKNQQLFSECMSNYLPDDDDPQYSQYEAKLPEYRKELERRYPLICTRCAPLAQTSIHNADLYSQTSALARNMRKSRANQFHREGDSSRMIMRSLLKTLNSILHVSLFAQAAWHAYGATSIHFTGSLQDRPHGDIATAYSLLGRCGLPILGFRFTSQCFHSATPIVSKGLLASLLLIWLNPAWRYLWDDHRTLEATFGETQYYGLQIITLAIRTVAYFGLGHLADDPSYSLDRIKAFHFALAVFLPFVHWLSRQGLGYRKRSVNTKIMPMPEECDILGRDAGPAERRSQAQASSMNPLRLFQRDNQPFPVRSLVPKSMFENTRPTNGHPSPPASEPSSPGDDAMDIEWTQPTRAQNQSGWPGTQNQTGTLTQRGLGNHQYQSTGWSSMRDETFRIQNSMREDNERRRREAEAAQQAHWQQEQTTYTNPFRGTLPPAPMSMERRLRNPPRQTPFQPAKPAAQSDFMSKMREGIESASTFCTQPGRHMKPRDNSSHAHDSDLDGSQYDPDEATMKSKFTRAESAAMHEHNIRPGRWTLKQDLDAQATGLEDLFGGKAFRIADEHGGQDADGSIVVRGNSTQLSWKFAILAGLVGLAAMMWLWLPARRAIALYLLGKLERLERWLLVYNGIPPPPLEL